FPFEREIEMERESPFGEGLLSSSPIGRLTSIHREMTPHCCLQSLKPLPLLRCPACHSNCLPGSYRGPDSVHHRPSARTFSSISSTLCARIRSPRTAPVLLSLHD